MSRCRIVLCLMVFASVAKAEVKVVVELVPDQPRPYVGGELLTVDVWLHSEVSFEVYLYAVVFDFSDSDPALSLAPTFTFDLSAILDNQGHYGTFPELPVPVVGVILDGPIFPENMLPLPAGGSLHIGSIGLQLPTRPGLYRLDLLNRDEQDIQLGALIHTFFSPGGEKWRAFTGEITGGTFDFPVEEPIPTVSEWGLIVMTCFLLGVGCLLIMRRTRVPKTSPWALVLGFSTVLVWVSPSPAQSSGAGLNVRQTNGRFELTLDNGPPFHVTERPVTNPRLVDVANSTVRVALWDELTPSGQAVPFYGISLDGVNMNRVTATSYDLMLRYARFDPSVTVPAVPPSLQAHASSNLYIVQFITQPLEAYRTPIEQFGGTIYNFLANHSHIVKMTPAVKTQVEALPIVRSVVPYHPAYRLEEFMRDNLDRSAELFPLQRYNIQVFEPGPNQKGIVAARIAGLGGTVNTPDAGKFLLEATLTPEQLLQVVR